MKFQTERISLVKWRFWFVVWSKNFATMATWLKDFSSLLAKKNNNNSNLARAQHTTMHDYSTTTMWNFMLENVYVLTDV